MLVSAQCFRHGVQPAGAARTATRDAKQRHPPARPKSVAGDRLIPIFGTGRNVAAGIADEIRQSQLIEPDEANTEKTAWGLRKHSPPVAGSPDLLPRLLMSAVRFTAHRLTRSVQNRPGFDLVESIDDRFEGQHGRGVACLEIPDG